MIKRSTKVAVVLFVVYNLCLFVSGDNSKYYPQNINQDNVIKIEEYLFNKNLPPNVIVGSSLAAKLNMDLLDRSYYNLAFRGQSIYDGFEIILSRKELPSQILIEYNVFLQSPYYICKDKGWLKYHTTNYIKKNILSQREKNQPVNRAILLAFNLRNRLKKQRINLQLEQIMAKILANSLQMII